MSRYDYLPLLETPRDVESFVEKADYGDAALYHCDPQVASDSPLAQCREVAWRLACRGLVALFKMRAENGRLQPVMLKLAPETARKLGSPQREIKP